MPALPSRTHGFRLKFHCMLRSLFHGYHTQQIVTEVDQWSRGVKGGQSCEKRRISTFRGSSQEWSRIRKGPDRRKR